ncbi:DNase I-like protein [Lentinus tigrinus ALCF2SS1-7]|uniref:DNase I-like protein n=1 Tax=Lentinus tigrinus ALCF2SS1-6 TaxID=1328759 RepID=A0A5C2SC31_9APHY|nr:DNase I-like protein [Lentinus tigrinus ALCF2SS1-6]RPD68062.1 DNase I-like protein [Lentinus tigrinus ALCF2SS1-7]
MSTALDIAQEIIRPTEDVKVAIDTRSAPRPDSESEQETWPGSDHEPPVPRRKILAVVSHVHADGKHEHGCVFVFTHKPPLVHSIPDDYLVEHAFPIIHGFSISMSQPRQTTLDLSSPAAGSSFSLNQPKTELTVTINPGEDTPFSPITLQTHDIQGLRRLLDECKRLKEAFAMETADDFDFEPFGWVAPYMADHALPPLLSSIPPDLRKLKKPVHTRLSAASAGMPGDDISDVEIIREEWMRSKVEDELFSRGEKAGLNIRVGTFNVNGKFPSQDLSAWVRGEASRPPAAFIPPLKEISPLSLGESQKNPVDEALATEDPSNGQPPDATSTDTRSLSAVSDATTYVNFSVDTQSTQTAVSDAPPDVPEDPSDPDMLVLGFQELDLSTDALLYSTKTVREEAWCMAVFAGLGEKAVLYEKLASKQLVGMLLVIIVKKRLRPNFSEIRGLAVGVGIMGIMGNKGATAIRLLFTPTPFPSAAEAAPLGRPTVLTFVNAHLAAFDEMYEKRNADFQELSKRLVFEPAISVDEQAANGSWYSPAAAPLSIFESDALFWLGDLNYRLTPHDADVRSLLADDQLREENIKTLRRFDQLSSAMRTKKAFEDFVEQPIRHLPSYRFSAGVHADGMGYDMKRKPAWTDRILHMASKAVTVKQRSYTSHATITMSDHRPVSAEFELEVPALGLDEYESFVQRVWRDVSAIEYVEERPRVRVGPTNIDFAKISYTREVTRSLEVVNVGKVPCSFRFVPQGPAADICPPWLRINPVTGLVLPGEKVDVTLTAQVDEELASKLNLGQAHLEDTLVLHTALGRDHFVAVSADYERTCFTTSLSWLVRLPGPVRELKSPDDVLPEDRGVNAPREIMRLVNWLMSNATETVGLFFTPGDEELMRQIREKLDTGEEFNFGALEKDPKLALAFADTLVRLLESLSEPVIPPALHTRCSQMTSRDEAFELLDDLPVVNVNVWISLTAFLHFLGQQDAYQGRVEQLVAIFTPVLFRDDLTSPMPVSIIGRRNFLRYFIG